MIGALWTGISGLAAQQTALDNESHNIANVNTIGYKASRISFADQIYQNRIGKGSIVIDSEKVYKQGNLKLTGVSYDMALSGDGFFSMSGNGIRGTSEIFYTRAGNFRMGDSGTLQDPLGHQVQGWAMSKMTPSNVTSTDHHVSTFNDKYTKLIASQNIRKLNTIETIAAKSTDYNQTAKTDAIDVFTGAGYKTKSSKVSDIETLITKYSKSLTAYKDYPDLTSKIPGYYSNTLDFSNIISSLNGEGDIISVVIDSNQYSQQWDTDLSTTLKRFADVLSKVSVLNAYVTDDIDTSTRNPSDVDGYIKLECLEPGKMLEISEAKITSESGVDSVGLIKFTKLKVDKGSGYALVEESSKALQKAISGNVRDVYSPTDLNTPDAAKDYEYQLTIYDKQSKDLITVPSTPLVMNNPADVDAMVAAINTGSTPPVPGELPFYVKAINLNGSLVIETLDKYFDLEISGAMKQRGGTAETQTISIGGTATGQVSFLGQYIAGSVAGDNATLTGTKILADKDRVILTWNTNNPNKELKDITITGTTITLTYKETEGDVADILAKTSNGITFGASNTTTQGNFNGAGDLYDIGKNPNYSGRKGGAAEFLEVQTKIEQATSQTSLQLKLDFLGISDNPFGEFHVDKTGMITMKQDGAVFAVGQVAIAMFNNNRGLEPQGDNLCSATLDSGSPIYNIDNAKAGEIRGKTLELSTADLSESLVNLMVFQRAFEANAKSITTADTILNTLIQLKR